MLASLYLLKNPSLIRHFAIISPISQTKNQNFFFGNKINYYSLAEAQRRRVLKIITNHQKRYFLSSANPFQIRIVKQQIPNARPK
jgi:hypothetical protein